MHGSRSVSVLLTLLMIVSISLTGANVRADGIGTLESAGSFTDQGVDSDSNGLFDSLNVTAVANVSTPGAFRICGYLYDGAGITLIAFSGISDHILASSGLHQLNVSFPGTKIYLNGIDGPYRAEIILYNGTGAFLDGETYFTSAYIHTQFEKAPIEWIDVHSDRGVDTDSDSLYDYLEVNVTFTVNRNSSYLFSAFLKDENRTTILSTQSVESELSIGNRAVTFDFPGYHIQPRGFNGTYAIEISVYCDYDSTTYQMPMFKTDDYYLASQFEPPGFVINSLAEFVIDTDFDGELDEIELVYNVTVVSPGAYAIDSIAYHDDYLGEHSYLGEYFWSSGFYELSCSLDVGWRMEKEGDENRSFEINATALCYARGEWTVIKQYTFLTDDSYNATDFGRKVVQPKFIGDPEIDVVDDDLDGLYDHLELRINVTGGANDWFVTRGELWSDDPSQIGKNYSGVYVNASTNTTIVVSIPGWIINESMTSPHHFDIFLCSDTDDESGLLDSLSAPIPGTYNASDFGGAPLTMTYIDDYGIDKDADGKFDYLVLETEVSANFSGTCTMVGCLKTGNETAIVEYSWQGYLPEGRNLSVLFYFNGLNIAHFGLDAPYIVDILLTDPNDNTADLESLTLMHLYAADAFEQNDMTVISGTVIEDQTGIGISGVNIQACNEIVGFNTTLTNASGGFSFSIPKGIITIECTVNNYADRTVIINAQESEKRITIRMCKPITEDSVLRGFLTDSDGAALTACSSAMVLNIGNYSMREFETGPAGYYEIPVRYGPIVLMIGDSSGNLGLFELFVDESSSIWENLTAQLRERRDLSIDNLLLNWNAGLMTLRLSEMSWDLLESACVADAYAGNCDGALNLAEAEMLAHMRVGWMIRETLLDTANTLLIDDEFFDIGHANLGMNCEGVIGEMETMGLPTFLIGTNFSSHQDIQAQDDHIVTVRFKYDDNADGGNSTEGSRMQLFSTYGLVSASAPPLVAIEGENLVTVDPETNPNPVACYGLAELTVASGSDPSMAALIGTATLTDRTDHSGILMQVRKAANYAEIAHTYTNPDGGYMIMGIAPEEIVIMGTMSGYYPAGEVVSLVPGEIDVVDLVLYPTTTADITGSIQGTVIDEIGVPIESASITAEYISNSTLASTVYSTSDGGFSILNLVPAAYRITVSDGQRLPVLTSVFVNVQQTIDLGEITLLWPTGAILGTLIDDGGKPLSDLTVKLFDDSWNLKDTISTNAAGDFDFDRLLDGVYHILIFKGDRQVHNQTDIVVAGGNETDLGIIVIPASMLADDYTLLLVAGGIAVAIIIAALIFFRRPAGGVPSGPELRQEPGEWGEVAEEEYEEPAEDEEDY